MAARVQQQTTENGVQYAVHCSGDRPAREAAPPSSAGSAIGDDGARGQSGMPRSEGGGSQGNRGVGTMAGDDAPDIHVRSMPGYDESFMGGGVNPVSPLFNHGNTLPGGWQEFGFAGAEGGIVPARAMVFNVPAECFTLDANGFKDWQSPLLNSVRVASIAALIGLVSTPLSKGWL